MPVNPRLEGTITRNKMLVQIYISFKHLGYPPTYRNIMKHTGIKATSAIAYHLQVLEEQGLIVRGKKGEARALGLTKKGQAQAELLRETAPEYPREIHANSE